MLTDLQMRDWNKNGYFVLPRFADEKTIQDIDDQITDALASDPPTNHLSETHYAVGDLIISLESQKGMTVVNPIDAVSRVFNAHLDGAGRDFSCRPDVGQMVSSLLGGDDVDVFQSQFIYKNPGAWGQPWHQDSYYFHFDPQPQIGLWLAISEATHENGCLAVLPGSHKEPIHKHLPDSRPNANLGYVEIRDQNFDAAESVLMAPGDLLVFHSFLMHRSYDNKSDGPRKAMVYHHGRAGTEILLTNAKESADVTHFRPAFRN